MLDELPRPALTSQYDETFEGGREFLRVLNELISDFDEILDRRDFRNVEKIKTIGSTFMAAAGINNDVRDENTHAYAHLNELMGFVLELQKSVDEFNQASSQLLLTLGIANFGTIGTMEPYCQHEFIIYNYRHGHLVQFLILTLCNSLFFLYGLDTPYAFIPNGD